MRWERLFAELEGHLDHDEQVERDALVEDLREGEWAQVSWTQLVHAGTDVELWLPHAGLLRGRVTFVNAQVIHLVAGGTDHVVSVAAVTVIAGSGRPSDAAREATSRLGWGQVLRDATDEDELRFTLTDGQVVQGRVDVVGRDFVRILRGSGSAAVVPFATIELLTVVV